MHVNRLGSGRAITDYGSNLSADRSTVIRTRRRVQARQPLNMTMVLPCDTDCLYILASEIRSTERKALGGCQGGLADGLSGSQHGLFFLLLVESSSIRVDKLLEYVVEGLPLWSALLYPRRRATYQKRVLIQRVRQSCRRRRCCRILFDVRRLPRPSENLSCCINHCCWQGHGLNGTLTLRRE